MLSEMCGINYCMGLILKLLQHHVTDCVHPSGFRAIFMEISIVFYDLYTPRVLVLDAYQIFPA